MSYRVSVTKVPLLAYAAAGVEFLKELELEANEYYDLSLDTFYFLDFGYKVENDWGIYYTKHFKTFDQNISYASALLKERQDADFSLLVMTFLHSVSALEYYLYSVFLSQVMGSEKAFRKYVETNPKFQKQKFALSEIFTEQKKLKETVAQNIKEFIFHNVYALKPLYKDVIGFDFDGASWLAQAISVRHDCAHRAGFTKEGKQTKLTVNSVEIFISDAEHLVASIETHLR